MDVIMAVVSFVRLNWIEILAVIGAVDVILGIVSKMTPWTWDDSVYTMLHSLVSKLGGKK